MLTVLNPEIVYVRGNATVPAKALTYKIDPDGHPIETIRPRTHEFENELKADLKKELAGVISFPTDKEILISIIHGVHSKEEYKRHDLDNRSKTILDALKEVVYIDDSQVSVLWSCKQFLEKEQESYFRLAIKLLDSGLKSQLINEMNKSE